MNCILVTSASRKVPLIRELKRASQRLPVPLAVLAGDICPNAIAQYAADDFWQMPCLEDIAIGDLIYQCQSRGVSVILPTRDGELGFWSRHREAFSFVGIHVIISQPEAIARCRDKKLFAEFGVDCGFPIIPAADSPEPFAHSPLVVKERFGAGSRGIGLRLSLNEALKHARLLQQPLFQPFVSGTEVSIDAWVSKTGEIPGVVLRRRDVVVSGESHVTTSFRDAHLEQAAVELIKALNLRGPIVLQAIITDAGPAVIECNPRFGGASTASIAVGLDSLFWSMAEAQVDDFHPTYNRAVEEIRQVRFLCDRVIYGPNF